MAPASSAGTTSASASYVVRTSTLAGLPSSPSRRIAVAPSVTTRLVVQLRSQVPPQDALSDRELEVLSLIAKGETNRGAAARLFISEATVKTHLLHVYAKLEVNDRAAAVAKAFERGLLPVNRG